MINYYYKSLKDNELKEVDKALVGCWVNIITADVKELEKIAAELNLEAGHLTDVIDQNEVPRVETEGEHFYCFVRLPITENDETRTMPVLFVYTPDNTITVSVEDSGFLGYALKNNGFNTTQKSKVFLQFIKYIFSQYQATLSTVAKKSNAVFSRTIEARNEDVLNLVGFEETVNELMSAIVPTKEGLNLLTAKGAGYLHKEDHDLIEDAELMAGQILVLAKNQMQSIKNVREAYSTVITNNLNRVVKLFTSLTVVMTIPTIIFSFYGMNVSLPYGSHNVAAALIGLFTLLLVAGTVLLLSKKKMI